jgi:hypothetical protein
MTLASPPADDALQALCEQGSELLVRTRYLEAEATLARAEEIAWAARDWDTLGRLYMPLQEARRQRRQRCGDGTVKLDWVAQTPYEEPNEAATVLQAQPNGQMLVAGWGTIQPAVDLRRLAAEQMLYAETFLAAVYPVADPVAPTEMARVVVVAPLPDAAAARRGHRPPAGGPRQGAPARLPGAAAGRAAGRAAEGDAADVRRGDGAVGAAAPPVPGRGRRRARTRSAGWSCTGRRSASTTPASSPTSGFPTWPRSWPAGKPNARPRLPARPPDGGLGHAGRF